MKGTQSIRISFRYIHVYICHGVSDFQYVIYEPNLYPLVSSSNMPAAGRELVLADSICSRLLSKAKSFT